MDEQHIIGIAPYWVVTKITNHRIKVLNFKTAEEMRSFLEYASTKIVDGENIVYVSHNLDVLNYLVDYEIERNKDEWRL